MSCNKPKRAIQEGGAVLHEGLGREDHEREGQEREEHGRENERKEHERRDGRESIGGLVVDLRQLRVMP